MSNAARPVVRDAIAADLAAVLALNQAAVPEVAPTDAATLAWFLAEAFRFWVLDDGGGSGGDRGPANGTATGPNAPNTGSLGGFLIALTEGSTYPSPNYRWFAQRYERFVYVDRVAVAAGWRRRGVGRQLYERLIAVGGEVPWPVLCAEVNVRPRNDPSLAFHAALGFTTVGETEDERHHTRVAMLVRPLP